MKEKLHDHITAELLANEKSNTTFVIAALVINILTLSINAAVSIESDSINIVIMILLLLLSISFSTITVIALKKGKHIRSVLMQGLTDLYSDEGIAKYYDQTLLSDYSLRYNLLKLIIIILGAVSVAIPLLIMGLS